MTNIGKSGSLKQFFTAIFVIAVVVLIILGVYQSLQLKKSGDVPKTEKAPLPEIDVYKIIPASCSDCFDISIVEQFVAQTAQAKIIVVKSLKSDTSEAKEIVRKYKITRLPALFIKGETSRVKITQFEQRDDALVFDSTPAPYFDVTTGKIKGQVRATIITDQKCKNCFDLKLLVAQLKKLGVLVADRTLDYSSLEAQNLIQKYKIKKVPSMLLSVDAQEYSMITNAWDSIGTKERDGTFVLRTVNPPFKDLETGEIKQLPSLIYILDKSCTKCYNASLHKNLLESNFGMSFEDEKYVDVSSKEGTRLANKYRIILVPTVIVSSHAKEYNGFAQVWKQVGDVALDGSFVFTRLDLLEGMTYKDLKAKKEITATQGTTSS